MNSIRSSLLALVLPLGLALGGCGDSGDTTEATGEEAKAAAIAALAKTINTASAGLDSTVLESEATHVVADTGVVDLPVSPRIKAAVLDRLNKAKSSPLMRAITLHGDETTPPAETDLVSADELDHMLVIDSESTNSVTYKLNTTELCTDETGAAIPGCADALNKVSIVQSITSDTSGTLTIKVNESAPLVIGYSENSIYIEVSLADLKTAAEEFGASLSDAIDAGSGLADSGTSVNAVAAVEDTITSFSGKIKLTITVDDATVGSENVTVALEIVEAINIAGTSNGADVSLSIAASEVIEVTADAGADTATVTLGLGMVHAMLPMEGYSSSEAIFPDTEYPSEIHLGGMTGTFTFSGDTLAASGVGMGGGMAVDVDNDDAEGDEDMRMTLADMDMSIDGATGMVTFTNGIEFSMSVTNTHGVFADTFDDGVDINLDPTDASLTGTLALAATDGTELMVMHDDLTDMTTNMTHDGTITITGTGFWGDAGPITSTNTANTCFTDAGTTHFPVKTVECSMP